ncbi:MAG: glycosyltransferase family 87 protein [Cyanobacteria bacterium P01_E01_bin.42]
MSRILQNPIFRITLLAGSILFLLGFGILGWGRGAPFGSQYDMRFLYIAGRLWLSRMNAYDSSLIDRVSEGLPETDRVYDFAYPPQISFLAMFLSLFTWERAKTVLTFLNLISIGAIVYFCINFWRSSKVQINEGLKWYVPVLIIGAPFSAETIWLGQTSLIVSTFLLGSWYFYCRKRWLISGLLLGISTIKPQFCILFFLWLLLERRWKILGIATASSLALCIVPLSIESPIALANSWFSALDVYKLQPFNVLGWPGKIHLQNWVYLLTEFALPNLLLLACILTVFLWKFRPQVQKEDVFGILTVFSLVLGFGNYYDLVMAYILIPLFWHHFHRNWQKIIGLGLYSWIAIGNFIPRFFAFPRWVVLFLKVDMLLLLLSVFWLWYLSSREYEQT